MTLDTTAYSRILELGNTIVEANQRYTNLIRDAAATSGSRAAAAMPDRLASDQGGHYIGRRFGGSSHPANLFAQDGNWNQGRYNNLEASWQRQLANGDTVRVVIVPRYSSVANQRPSGISVVVTVNGVTQRVQRLENRARGQ